MTDARSPVKHVVLFKVKEGTAPETIADLIEGYKDLPAKISAMKHFEGGPDISTEGLRDGYTHCFITTFADTAGRDAYIPHEAHQAYVKVLLPHLDKLLVLDYQPQP